MGQSAVRAFVAPPRLFSSLRQKRYIKISLRVSRVVKKFSSKQKKFSSSTKRLTKLFSNFCSYAYYLQLITKIILYKKNKSYL